MEEITIVKRRSRVWAVLLLLLVIAVLLAGALWFMGEQGIDQIGMAGVQDETGGRARLVLQI